MYYCAGGSLALLSTGAALGIPAIFLFMMHGYQKQRLVVWLDPTKDPSNAGYNIIQSLVAFVGGGFFGVGYGNSKQKLSWLPEGHTDFIFSIIAEEFGFLGCLFIIGLFIVFLRRGFITATRCPDKFGKLLAFGITFSITAQAFINMGVASGFLPASGIPLPFISYGGSSLFISLCMVGVLLSISKKRVQKISPMRLGYEAGY
jgi:cell division protein FtsW